MDYNNIINSENRYRISTQVFSDKDTVTVAVNTLLGYRSQIEHYPCLVIT